MTVDPSAEILRLRATVRDLLGLSTIPEAWVGREPPAIAADLADLLIGSLELDFAFVRLCDPTGGQVVEVARGNSWKAFPEWLQEHLAAFGQISRKEIVTNVSGLEEPCCGIVIPIGVNSERGLVAAASDRSDFPDQIDQQLLSVAANTAATAFQNAFLIKELRCAQEALRATEQELRKARDGLEIRVTERTSELQKAFEEIKGLKDRLYDENLALREHIVQSLMFEEIVGSSPALQKVLSKILKVAPADSTVLITGETGTGKELVARAIHRHSQRSSQAFIGVNCAATPRDLIASELFGHEKGAFTGATRQRLGRFELANGGTIFLDEVGDLPAETQVALLRVLQEHEFERVGGTRRIHADVRVIAATNRDLQAAISAGSFRNDLFYRLNVFPIEIPPLRGRREDIPLLVEYFIDRYARKAGKKITDISKKTLELLQSYPWPGNIRELQNVIERSVILCETEIFSIDESWLPQQPTLAEPRGQLELPVRLVAQEKTVIEAALKESRGRVFGPTGAAARLGIPRSTLESKIRSLKIDKNRFKQFSQ
jgi:transcriptional regulator with GAF, ATPase, and Fis domain